MSRIPKAGQTTRRTQLKQVNSLSTNKRKLVKEPFSSTRRRPRCSEDDALARGHSHAPQAPRGGGPEHALGAARDTRPSAAADVGRALRLPPRRAPSSKGGSRTSIMRKASSRLHRGSSSHRSARSTYSARTDLGRRHSRRSNCSIAGSPASLRKSAASTDSQVEHPDAPSPLDRLLRVEKCGVLNANYQMLAESTHLHRSSCQRIVKNTAERLAMHVLNGDHVHVCTSAVESCCVFAFLRSPFPESAS